jgi:hypothetical protein
LKRSTSSAPVTMLTLITADSGTMAPVALRT